MTLTDDEYREIKALIDAGYNTKKIMRRTGYSQEQVLEARRVRRLSIERERSAKYKRERAMEEALEETPACELDVALRGHRWPVQATDKDLAIEDAAYIAGRKVPGLRELGRAAA